MRSTSTKRRFYVFASSCECALAEEKAVLLTGMVSVNAKKGEEGIFLI